MFYNIRGDALLTELANAIKDSIISSLEDRVSVAFSGGVDSSIIAWVSKNYADTELFTTGIENSHDISSSEESARIMGLRHIKIIPDEKEIISTYNLLKNMLKLGFFEIGILIPLFLAAREAKRHRHVCILYGTGTEELFGGYDRHYRYMEEGKDILTILRKEYAALKHKEIAWIKKMCYRIGIEPRFPFYNDRIMKYVYSMPVEEIMGDKERKKPVLREVAKLLGLPDKIIERKKKAAQYGSGIHKMLMKYSKKGVIEK